MTKLDLSVVELIHHQKLTVTSFTDFPELLKTLINSTNFGIEFIRTLK